MFCLLINFGESASKSCFKYVESFKSLIKKYIKMERKLGVYFNSHREVVIFRFAAVGWVVRSWKLVLQSDYFTPWPLGFMGDAAEDILQCLSSGSSAIHGDCAKNTWTCASVSSPDGFQ